MGVLLLSAVLLSSLPGCAVDTDALITDTVQAALTSVVNSAVDSLSAYLAGT